jgi:hypothetical protein
LPKIKGKGAKSGRITVRIAPSFKPVSISGSARGKSDYTITTFA